jgi:hypothetical protein
MIILIALIYLCTVVFILINKCWVPSKRGLFGVKSFYSVMMVSFSLVRAFGRLRFC